METTRREPKVHEIVTYHTYAHIGMHIQAGIHRQAHTSHTETLIYRNINTEGEKERGGEGERRRKQTKKIRKANKNFYNRFL